MPVRPSANDFFGVACGQRRLGGAGPAGVPLVVLHGSGGASGVLRSCRRSAGAMGTIGGASGVPFALPGCRRPCGMLQQALLCCIRDSSNMLPSQTFLCKCMCRPLDYRAGTFHESWFLDLCSLLVKVAVVGVPIQFRSSIQSYRYMGVII